MSGTSCADFEGTWLANDPTTGLCVMPAGNVFAGLITYPDGRVATIVDSPNATSLHFRDRLATATDTDDVTIPDLSAERIELIRNMQGTEIGNCAARGTAGVSFFPMRSHYEGEDIAWSDANARELSRILGVSGTHSGSSFFCANPENARDLVVANDAYNNSRLLDGIDALESSCGELDGTHCAAMLASLRTAAHEPEPETWSDRLLEGALYVGGLLGVGLTFLGVHVAGARYSARADAAEAVREANFAANRAGRFAEEANTPEARRQAEIARDAARDAEIARRAGRPREARRLEERARAAADEAERIASARPRGPNDGGPPAAGEGGEETGVPGGSEAPNPGTTARVAIPDAAAGILAFHGEPLMSSPDGISSPVSSTGGPVRVPGALPVPVIPAPVAVPMPVVASRPVVVPRLVPAL